MLANIRRVLLVVVVSAIAGAGSLAWADHGHGGGHGGGWSGGHGWSGGGWSGGHGWSGGRSNVSYGRFGGYSGFNNYWGGGGRYYTGYRSYGWPYGYSRNYYYRPYASLYLGYPYAYGYGSYLGGYYGYPSYYYSYPSDYYVGSNYSYPSDYYVSSNEVYSGDARPAGEYVVSRPVADCAQVQFVLPDPQATIWVQGQEISSAGTTRQFRSPPLDPSQQYTYTVKAEWNDNGKRVTEERQVKVQANDFAVVDFNQPPQAASDAARQAMPDLPPPQHGPTIQ